jgi:polyisoprenyl-phosphate glycosyltransferase
MLSESNPPVPFVISVVVPLYNEEKNVPVFAERLQRVFERIGCQWEIVFALDPSPDATRERILDLIRAGLPIRLVTFARRIGKPLSLLAGLDYSRGDACVVIDVDLQDPPELIEQMVEKWREGFKVVIAQRSSRKGENFFYLKAAQLFYVLLERFAQVEVPRNTGDYRLLDARVVREVCRFRERHGFLRGITAAVGFPTALITFDRDPRLQGRTQISLLGAVNIALDGMIPFSRVPVRAIFLLGLAILGIAGCAGGIWLLTGLFRGFSDHWPIILLSMLSLGVSGLTITCMGIIGEYLVRTYEEARNRPLYVVGEILESQTIPVPLGTTGVGAAERDNQ